MIMVFNIHRRNLHGLQAHMSSNMLQAAPRFPQSNGQVERVKRLLKRSNDPYLALLTYRVTPLPWCDLSPAQLSMGRRIRTPIPQTNKFLVPSWAYLKTFHEKNEQLKHSQKRNYIGPES